MKRAFLIALLILLLPFSAGAAGKNKRQVVMSLTEVATDTPVTATVNNSNNAAGYLIVKTENEAATADMVITVLSTTVLGDTLLCTLANITTDTTSLFLLGSTVAATGAILTVCDFPMPRRVKFTFTTTGVGADFDVTAEMAWLTN